MRLPFIKTLLLAGAVTLVAAPRPAAAQVIIVAPNVAPFPQPVLIRPPLPLHVRIHERIRWHLARAAAVAAAVTPPPVYYAAPTPPAPTYYTQSAPVYVTPTTPVMPPVPPPIIAPAPYGYGYYAPAAVAAPAPVETVVVARPAQPGWGARFGVGARGGFVTSSSGWTSGGFGGELLWRASPHWVTEFAAEYNGAESNGISRHDVPVTFGARLHIGAPRWVVSPYLVGAVGLAFSDQDLLVTHDSAPFALGQLGGGLELRLGQHVAITGDVRFEARKRLSEIPDAVAATVSVNGKPVHPLDDSVGAVFRLGLALYF